MSIPDISRRALLRGAASAATAVIGAPFLNLGRSHLFGWSPQEYTTRCIDLVRGSLVIDMLGLTTLNGRTRERWGPDFSGLTAEDAVDFRESGIDVFHIARGVGGRTADQAYENAMRFVGAFNSIIANRPDIFVRIDSAEDLASVQGSGRSGILIGLQDSAHFRSPADVRTFHELGQRVSQLTYNARNMIGNGSTERVDGGISDFGVTIIEQMNTVGMAVDVSHSGDRTTLDACALSGAPVLFTHSNARALNPGHPRCKTDEAISKMGETGGVMGITGVRNFVAASEPTTIEHYLDHFDHVRDLIGVEHLGIGSDIDLQGYDDMPPAEYQALKANYKGSYAFRDKIDIDEIAHPKRMFDVTDGLIRRGYTDEHIRGILGGNFQRVLGGIWAA
ncbi:MAG: membrane dipeptidase [Gemmatimonadetes bacterium]|nr:membrane dipeptidase [Gemmatimonadota bacterium]MDA1103117.1 membrane dipeptidase [Gemmatimonadota bacterium]